MSFRVLQWFACLVLAVGFQDFSYANCKDNTKPTDPNVRNILDYKFTSVDLFGLGQVRYHNYGPKVAAEGRVLSLPFLQMHFMNTYPDVNSAKRPSKQIMMLDWPVICVYDWLGLGDRHGDPNAPRQQSVDAEQWRIFDTLIFCGYDHEIWRKGQSFTEYGRLPLLATCYMHEKTIERERTRIADIHIVSAYKDDNRADGVRETEVADLTLAHGFKYVKHSNENQQWSAVAIPAFSLMNGRSMQDKKHFAVLSSEAMNSVFGSPGDPVLGMFLHDESNTAQSAEILRLPFIGPLWAQWSIKGKESYGTLLPNIIKHEPYKRLKENIR